MSKSRSALSVALLIALGAAACGSDDGDGPVTETSAADTEQLTGGTLIVGRSTDTGSLDTQNLVSGEDIIVKRLLFTPLVEVAPDGDGIVPGIAEDWDVDTETNTYTFNIREATFADGTPITPADVKFSIEYAAGAAAYGELLSGITSIATPDEQTVVVSLAGPDNLFLYGLAFSYVIPQDFNGNESAEFFADPLSSGPFVLESWDPNSKMILSRNTNFWDPERPGVDAIEFRIIPDANQRLVAFEAGDIDIYEYLPHQLAAAVPDGSLVELETTSRVLLLLLNNAAAPFDQVSAREAAGLAINRDELVETVWSGRASSVDGIIQPGLAGLPESAGRWTFDPARAQEIVETLPNRSFRLLAPNQREVDPVTTQAIQNYLVSVGFDVPVETPDFGTALDQLFSADYDMFAVGNGAYLPTVGEPMLVYATFFGPIAGWAGLDQLEGFLDDYRTAETDAARLEASAAFEDYIATSRSVIPVASPSMLFAVSDRVQGFIASPAGVHQPDRVRLND